MRTSTKKWGIYGRSVTVTSGQVYSLPKKGNWPDLSDESAETVKPMPREQPRVARKERYVLVRTVSRPMRRVGL